MVFILHLLVLVVLLAASAKAQQSYRLTGGLTQYSGTVEVFRNGQWQTVCDDGWDYTEGNLVCSLLGYGPAIGVYSDALFGEGAGSIWVKDWECTGRENSLEECPSGSIIYCSDDEAAGVSCTPPPSPPSPTPTTTSTSTTTSPTSSTVTTTSSTVTITSSAITTASTSTTSTSATVTPTSSATESTSATPPLSATISSGLPSYAWYIIGVAGLLLILGCLVCTCCITCSIMAGCRSNSDAACSYESCCPWKCRCWTTCKNSIGACCYYAWMCLCCPCIVFCSDKDTLQQYKQDITGVCCEAVDEEAGVGGGVVDNVATVDGGVVDNVVTVGGGAPDNVVAGGDGAVDNVATDDNVGCEGCILSMQSSVQACCFIPYAEDEDQRQN